MLLNPGSSDDPVRGARPPLERQLVALALGKSTGKWAEKDRDVALELARDAKMPMRRAGLVGQLVRRLNQERMKALLW